MRCSVLRGGIDITPMISSTIRYIIGKWAILILQRDWEDAIIAIMARTLRVCKSLRQPMLAVRCDHLCRWKSFTKKQQAGTASSIMSQLIAVVMLRLELSYL